jgi:hypothetical protein
MRTDYKIVLGMALFGGAVASTVIYVGGLFAPQPVTAAAPVPPTLPPPKVSTGKMPTSTAVPVPTPTAPAEPELRARLSHYWPAWGGSNCHPANWDGINCNALLSDGETWEHWSYFAEWGMACPIQYELGTQFKIEGFGTGVWTCVDRGGAIAVLPDGTFFVDLLTRDQPYIPPGEAEVIYDDYSPSGSYVVTVTIME